MLFAQALDAPTSWLQLAGSMGTVGIVLFACGWLIIRAHADSKDQREKFENVMTKKSDALAAMAAAVSVLQKEVAELRVDLKQEK